MSSIKLSKDLKIYTEVDSMAIIPRYKLQNLHILATTENIPTFDTIKKQLYLTLWLAGTSFLGGILIEHYSNPIIWSVMIFFILQVIAKSRQYIKDIKKESNHRDKFTEALKELINDIEDKGEIVQCEISLNTKDTISL